MKPLTRCAGLLLSLCFVVFAHAAPPSQPQNLQQAFLDTSESLLLWDETPDATSYNVYRSDASNTWTLVTSGLTQPRWRDQSWQLLPSLYAVAAVNGDGEGALSDIATVNFAPQYYIWMNDLSIWNGNVTATNATVNWSTSNMNGDQGFVEWGTAETNATNFTFFLLNTNYLLSHTFVLTNLTPATLYNYRVTSIGPERGGVSTIRSFYTAETNRPPVVNFYTFPYGFYPLSISFWFTDVDFPPQNITFTMTQPTNGTLTEPQSYWTSEGTRWGTMYQPFAGARGIDTFVITAHDGVESSAPTTITVSNWLNSLPEAGFGTTNILEDTATIIPVPNFDADGDPITFEIIYAYGGTLSGTPPNFLFTPNTNNNSESGFYYTATDGYGITNGFVWINIIPVNDPPQIATNWIGSTDILGNEEYPASIWLFVQDPDPIGMPEVVHVAEPTHGSLTVDVWNLVYTPEPNFFGTDQFTIAMRDGDGSIGDPVTFTVRVRPALDVPEPFDQDLTVLQGTSRVVTPTAFDAEVGPLTFAVGMYPMNGWLEITSTNWIYHPATNFIGEDSFTFYAGDSDTLYSWEDGTVRLHVVPQDGSNHAPDAADASVSLRIGETLNAALVVSDADGDSLNAELLTLPTNGVVSVSGTSFTYTANNDAAFQFDYFTYRVSDGQTNSRVAAMWVRIGNTNSAPAARDQVVTTIETRPIEIGLDVVDVDMQWLLQVAEFTPPAHGTVQFFGTNAVYQAETNFVGTDSFSYRVADGISTGNLATVTIQVLQNTPPVATDMNISVQEEWTVDFQLTGSDADGDGLTFVVLTPPAHGSLWVIPTSYPWSSPPGHCQYNGHINYVGTDSITYAWHDGLAMSAPATVTFNITPVNDRPTATNQSITTPEDTAVAITLDGADVDGDLLSYSIVSAPTNGTLTGAYRNYTFTPSNNFAGTNTFKFRVFDGSLSATGTVTIVVTAVNDAPVATNTTVLDYEDYPVTFVLGGTDVDNNITACTFTIVTPPAHGTLSGVNRVRTYTPVANYNGPDSFTFQISDGSATSGVGTVSLIVNPLPDAPVANAQSVTTAEDTSVNITLTGSDVDGDTLSYSVVSGPSQGTLSGTAPNLTYTPASEYFGSDSFVFAVSDGASNATATVSITVTPVNDLPAPQNLRRRIYVTDGKVRLWWHSVAGAQSYSVYRASVTNGPFTLLASGITDTNYQDSTAEYQHTYWYQVRTWDGTADGQPSNTVLARRDDTGVLTLDSWMWQIRGTWAAINFFTSLPEGTEGLLEYGTTREYGFFLENTNIQGGHLFMLSNLTPATVYYFSITATDSRGNAIRTGTNYYQDYFVTEAPPIAEPQSVWTMEEMAVGIALTGTDPNFHYFYLPATIVSGPTHGTLTSTGPNSYEYVPASNYFGADSFTFKVSNGELESAPATVSITVDPVNDVPVVADISVVVAEDAVAEIAASFTDVDGGFFEPYVEIVTQPDHGSVQVLGTNVYYLPATNYFGADSFTYTVSDSYEVGNAATLSITVTPVNDAPVASAQSLSLNEDSFAEFSLGGTDVDGDTLTYEVITSPTNGTLDVVGNNCTYTPANNFCGGDSLTFRAFDGTVWSAPATVLLTILPVNDVPVATAQSVSLAEDSSLVITLAGTDIDGDSLSFTIGTAPAHGTLSGVAPNITYAPNANFNGTDTFTFVVSDGTATSTGLVSVTVTPVNDLPVANGQTVIVAEDGSVAITLTGSDIDGDIISFALVTVPTNGTLSGVAPNLTYTPNANYNGTDSFTFTVSDVSGASQPATVNINVTPVNDAPSATLQSVSVSEDSSVAITLGGSDVEGSALTYAIVTAPGQGILSGSVPNLTYMPGANYNGSDSFTFTVNDGLLGSSAATVSINVTPVNDAPVANAQSVTVTYNTAKTITLTGSDLEGSALSYSIVGGPTNGTLSGTAPNLTYTPTVGSAGADRFTFRVNDGAADSAVATVSITTLNPTGISAAPTGLAVTVPTTSGTLILNWSCTATNEDGFKIERSPNGNNGWTQVATTAINVHTFTNSGLSSNTRYYYRVRSYNRLGNSAYSNTANGKTR